MKSIILDLCGGSGAWSKPYKDAGYTVINCTLPDIDICETLIYDDYMALRNKNAHYTPHIYHSNVIGILAAPPCTEFSLAKNGSHRSRDIAKGMETVEACMKIIWAVQKFGKLEFWALENPRGLLRRFLGKPAYTFKQWQFGEPRVKATDIWGYFNVPTPTVNERPHGLTVRLSNGQMQGLDWTKLCYPDEYKEYIDAIKGWDNKRAAARAITPAGFAKAFFKANSRRIANE